MITIEAKGGESVGNALRRAIKVAVVADDRVELIFNGIKLDVCQSSIEWPTKLEAVVLDKLNEYSHKWEERSKR